MNLSSDFESSNLESSIWTRQRDAGSTFVVSGAPLPSDMGIVRLMSTVELDRTWSLRLQADAEFAGRYASIGGTVRIAGRF